MGNKPMIARLAILLLLPLALASCVLAPGRFVSSLRINADRSFAFSYIGEVINADTSLASSFGDKTDSKDKAREAAKNKAEAEAKNRALAAALSKEAGYRKVAYLGDGVFAIDYMVKGTLGHAFIWPFNIDGEVILPFIAVELRQNGVVRVMAPAFANDDDGSASAVPGSEMLNNKSRLDGTFTLDTDAVIVSQNNEDGVSEAGGRKTMVWKATPALKSKPTAVLRLDP